MLSQVLLIVSSIYSAMSAECYALALEGGGGRGAYEAGVLSVLATSAKAGNIKWNAITGVSIGAVNAGIMSQYPLGQEAAMSQQLINFWSSLNGTEDIFTEWSPGGDIGLVNGLLFERGLYTNAPSISLALKWVTNPGIRNVTVGSTNFDLGIFQTFSENVGRGLIDGVIASGSLPFFFPLHQFEAYTWGDGGCIINLDVFSAVERCLELTTEDQITVDFIYDDPSFPLPAETTFKTIKVFERAYQIRSLDKAIKYTYETMNAFPKVYYRYGFIPSQQIEPLLNFSRASIEFDINLGIQDAQNKLSNFVSGRTIIEELYSQQKYHSTIYA